MTPFRVAFQINPRIIFIILFLEFFHDKPAESGARASLCSRSRFIAKKLYFENMPVLSTFICLGHTHKILEQ